MWTHYNGRRVIVSFEKEVPQWRRPGQPTRAQSFQGNRLHLSSVNKCHKVDDPFTLLPCNTSNLLGAFTENN